MVRLILRTHQETRLTLSPLRRATAGLVLLFLGCVAAPPAAAQLISLGSPNDPPRLALGLGAFDVIVDRKKPNSATTFMESAEYRFGDLLWIIDPLVGVQGTAQGSFYGYFGISFDIHLLQHLIFTPTEAFGYFTPGNGINLGSHWEFRDGAELTYRFDDERRIGISFYHMSNAGIGVKNPGQEMVTAVFTMPF
jgi:lipid A 3-O-deacylase